MLARTRSPHLCRSRGHIHPLAGCCRRPALGRAARPDRRRRVERSTAEQWRCRDRGRGAATPVRWPRPRRWPSILIGPAASARSGYEPPPAVSGSGAHRRTRQLQPTNPGRPRVLASRRWWGCRSRQRSGSGAHGDREGHARNRQCHTQSRDQCTRDVGGLEPEQLRPRHLRYDWLTRSPADPVAAAQSIPPRAWSRRGLAARARHTRGRVHRRTGFAHQGLRGHLGAGGSDVGD